MSGAQNLGTVVSGAVAALLTPEYIEKQVTAQAEKLVMEAIDDALRSFSETGKLIRSAVGDALKVHHLDLPSYGDTVATILKNQIEASVSELVAGTLSKQMEELLHLAPKEIKLSEIAKFMLQDADYDAEITCLVSKTSYGCTMVYLDENHGYSEDEAKRNADFEIHVHEGKILSLRSRERKVTGYKVSKAHGLEQKLMAYFACGTQVILDEDFVVTSKNPY